MIGSIAHPRPTLKQIRDASAELLVHRLAEGIGVDPARVFLTPGATEANAWVTLFRARAYRGRSPRVRVRLPEYPPLMEVAKWAGFRRVTSAVPVELAVVSQPRNPEGVLWSDGELDEWGEGARSVLIDETFREFTGAPSRAKRDRPGVWTTGTFTKFYAADDIRVGYAVAPPEEVAGFARFHGLVTDELSPFSVASALQLLDRGARFARKVRRLFEKNRATLAASLPLQRPLAAPVYFDRVTDGDRLARRCLRSSVLVCPGSFFGTRGGVRITLTRDTFPRDLAAYLKVRSRPG